MSPLGITQARVQPSKRGPKRASTVVRDASDPQNATEKTFHDEREATAYRLEQERKALARLLGEDGGTIDDVIDELLVNLGTRLRPDVLGHRRNWANRILSRFGGREIASITIEELEEFLVELRKADAACYGDRPPATRIWSMLRDVFTYALDTKRIVYNPIPDVAVGKSGKKRKPALPRRMPDAEQVKAMLSSSPPFLRRALAVSLLMGSRPSETVELDRQDLSPEDCSFHIWKQRENGEPKTEAGYRFAPVLDLLKSILGIEGDGADFAAVHGPLLVGEDGTRLTYSQFAFAFSEWQVEMGWARRIGRRKYRDHYTLNQLRHTFVALALWSDAPLASISATLGHASTDITETTYAYLISRKEAGLQTWGVVTGFHHVETAK